MRPRRARELQRGAETQPPSDALFADVATWPRVVKTDGRRRLRTRNQDACGHHEGETPKHGRMFPCAAVVTGRMLGTDTRWAVARRTTRRSRRPADTGEFGRAYARCAAGGRPGRRRDRDPRGDGCQADRGQIDDEIITPARGWSASYGRGRALGGGRAPGDRDHAARPGATARGAAHLARASRVIAWCWRRLGESCTSSPCEWADNLLRDAGYDVAMLGADVPTDALAAFASATSPARSASARRCPCASTRCSGCARIVHTQWPAAAFVVGGAGFTTRIPPGPASRCAGASPRWSRRSMRSSRHARLN